MARVLATWPTNSSGEFYRDVEASPRVESYAYHNRTLPSSSSSLRGTLRGRAMPAHPFPFVLLSIDALAGAV